MKKKWIAILIGLALLSLCAVAGAEVVGGTAFWTAGFGFNGGSKNITWELDLSTGVMKIGGSGGWNGYWLGHIPWGENMGDYCVSGDNYAEAKDYRSSIKKVIISEGVTNIASQAFLGCSNMTSVTIPSTVKSIDSEAFSGCSSLLNVVLPAGLNKIDNAAFYECKAMVSCDVPASVTSIGNEAFRRTFSLQKIVAHGNIGEDAFRGSGAITAVVEDCSSLGVRAFAACDNLSSVQLCEGISKIPDDAFANCPALNQINIPESVTLLGNEAFCECSSLSSITIPDQVTNIGVDAFSSCGLVSVKLPSKLTIMGESAFYNNINLTSVEVPGGLSTLPQKAFLGCTSLMNVTLSEGLQVIGMRAFYNCSSLQKIVLPESVKVINEDAFSSCKMLQSVKLPSGLSSAGDYAFAYCEALTGITLPDSLITLSSHLFCDSGLEWIAIPATLKSVKDAAFKYCTLKNVFFTGDESAKAKISITGENDEFKDAMWHCNEGAPSDPGHIWEISYTWAGDNSSVTAAAACRYANHQVTETVQTDEDILTEPDCETEGEAVYTTYDFENVLFEAQKETFKLAALGHDWQDPEYWWGDDYSSVTAIAVCSRDVSHIHSETVAATGVVLQEPTETEDGLEVYTSEPFATFGYVTTQITVPIPATGSSVPAGPYSDQTGNYNIGSDGNASFTKPAGSAATVTIPDTINVNGQKIPVTGIADNAFKGNKKLTTLNIGKHVKTIGKNAFNGAVKLKTVKGGAAVVTIKDGAFSGCKVLKTFPTMNKLQTIGRNAFKGCVKLTTFMFAKTVKKIGKNAFNGCKALKTITVKTEKLTNSNVEANAFKGINSKATFKCPKKKLKDYAKLFVKKGAPKTSKFK